MILKRISILSYLFPFLLLCSCNLIEDEFSLFSDYKPTREELDNKYEVLWSEEEIAAANTASDIPYLTTVEKEVFYYLNLARINPPLFAETYARGYEGHKGTKKGYAFDERKRSLIRELKEMEPVPAITHDPVLYELAKCFAISSGEAGLRGHDRSGTSCEHIRFAESCYYGNCSNGLIIVMSLLIDFGETNANLGHRRLCLNGDFTEMGASIQPHSLYTNVTVMDF